MEKSALVTLYEFSIQLPAIIDAAEVYWGKDQPSGKYLHVLKCEDHGPIVQSDWANSPEEWQRHVETVKFCHACGKPLAMESTELVNKDVGRGQFQMLVWSEEFRKSAIKEFSKKIKKAKK